MPEEKSWHHSVKFTDENITHIDCDLRVGKLVNKTTCVEICYSIMLDINERLKNANISAEIPKKLKALPKSLNGPERGDNWEFREAFGLFYEISPEYIRIITEDGHCIEIAPTVFLEMWDRYFKQSERVKKKITTL